MNMRPGAALALALMMPVPVSAQRGVAGPDDVAIEKSAETSGRGESGNYRITLAGFRVNHATYDDPLNRDGWGDEVYASVVLQRVSRRDGRVLETRTVTSQTYGDGSAARERVPQGHASDAGGLTAGDVVPFGWDERSAKPPVEKRRLPLVIWEGSLTEAGDVLLLRPALWEHDGDRTAFDVWTRSLTAGATWGTSGVQQSLETTPIASVTGPTLELPLDPGRDRPIGLLDHKWYDQVVVLNREKIEAALRQESEEARPPGLIALRLKEEIGKGRAPLNGDYILYLRVERQ